MKKRAVKWTVIYDGPDCRVEVTDRGELCNEALLIRRERADVRGKKPGSSRTRPLFGQGSIRTIVK